MATNKGTKENQAIQYKLFLGKENATKIPDRMENRY